MNVGATSILDQAYSDDDDSQASNDEENSMDDPEDDFELIELEDDLDNLMLKLHKLVNPEGLILNTFPRFGELAIRMPRKQFMLLPKLLFE